MNGRATADSAVNVMSRFTNRSACVCAAGRTMRAARASAGKKRRSRVRASARFVATGWRLLSSRGARSIAVVEVEAAAGDPVAEADQRVARALAGPQVERVEHLVDVHGHRRRLGERDRGAGAVAHAGLAGRDLDVLEAERGARAHDQPRVHRQRLDRLVELHVDGRVGLARARACGLDVVDHADPEAPDAHLVALHELVGVRELGAQVVGRHERQAAVRVVGEEDRHHDDEHGQGSDEDRAAGHARDSASLLHRPSFPRR